jgi:hypothetical protein
MGRYQFPAIWDNILSDMSKVDSGESWKLGKAKVVRQYNKKTARVCFLSGNVTQVVFLAGNPTRPQIEWVSQALNNMHDVAEI